MRLEAGTAQDFGAGGAGLPCGARGVPGMHQMFPAFHLPEHVDGRGTLRSTGLRGLHLPLLTDESVDTQSDKEAVVLPEIE